MRTVQGWWDTLYYSALALVIVFAVCVIALLIHQSHEQSVRERHVVQVWQQTVACVGRARDVAMPEIVWVDSIPGGFKGYADPVMGKVYLSKDYWQDDKILQHEFTHILVGHSGHPIIPFYMCGGLDVYGYNVTE